MAKRLPFALVVHAVAKAELKALRAFERSRIVDAIEANLLFDPLVASRGRKLLGDVKAGFEYAPPLRELKVGEFRVFYTVNDQARTVFILAVRRKPSGSTTEEVLR